MNRLKTLPILYLSIGFVLLGACGAKSERDNSANTPPALLKSAETASDSELLTALSTAFNARDTDQMRALWHDDVVWIELAGDQASVITKDAGALQEQLESYFQSFPSVKVAYHDITVNGRYITAIETVNWNDGDTPREQASNVVYEVVDAKVQRFWYLPAQ